MGHLVSGEMRAGGAPEVGTPWALCGGKSQNILGIEWVGKGRVWLGLLSNAVGPWL